MYRSLLLQEHHLMTIQSRAIIIIMMTKYLFYRSADRCDDNAATVLEFPTHENEMEIIHATNIHQSVRHHSHNNRKIGYLIVTITLL